MIIENGKSVFLPAIVFPKKIRIFKKFKEAFRGGVIK